MTIAAMTAPITVSPGVAILAASEATLTMAPPRCDVRGRDLGGVGGDVDDGAAALRRHVGQGRAAALQHPYEAVVHDPVQIRAAQLVEQGRQVVAAGRVDQQVDPSEGGQRLRHQPVRLRGPGHIGADEADIRVRRAGPKRLEGGAAAFGRAAVDHDPRHARLGELGRALQADARGAAGDDGDCLGEGAHGESWWGLAHGRAARPPSTSSSVPVM
jgi:hypothetical protein